MKQGHWGRLGRGAALVLATALAASVLIVTPANAASEPFSVGGCNGQMGNDAVSGWTYTVHQSGPCYEISVRLHISVYGYIYWGPWTTWRFNDGNPRTVNAFPPSGPYTTW